ncbi:MAG: DUF2461 domain-containing protein [bacterium]|nr:DUF2461 domain-containing protein [bacterium]
MDVEGLVIFLLELRMNNHKAWFDANRARYERLRAAFYADLQAIIDGFAGFDTELTGLKPKDCAFRINKRFPDKEGAYKTHFSAHFTEKGRGPSLSGYYFEITAEGLLSVGGGWYQPAPPHLAWIHADIAAHPEKITAILEAAAFRDVYGSLQDHRMKKLPKDFPVDHAQADLLRQKSFVVWREADVRAADGDLPGYVLRHYRPLAPLMRYLRTLQTTAPALE